MQTILLAILLNAAPQATLVGKTAWDPWQQWRVDRPNGPPLDVYFAGDASKKKPLVVLIQGSHCFPLFTVGQSNGRKRQISAALFSEPGPSLLERANFVMVERRGVKSFGPMPKSEDEAKALDHCTAGHGGVSKAERVADHVDVIRALAQQPFVSAVYVAGHSEGAYVASGVARSLGEKIAGVGLLSGPGPTQFFDWLLEARRARDAEAAKKVFDDMIWLTSGTGAGEYRGADVQRQITYGIDSTSIDDFRSSNVPLFVAQGTEDTNAPIESTDLFVAEMLREPKRQLRYLVMPGLDHGYRDAQKNDRSDEVLAAFVDWAKDGARGREVVTGPSK